MTGLPAGTNGWTPPPYPYDGLDELVGIAAAHPGGAVDLSIGTPCDPPPPEVIAALASSDTERGYPASIGSPGFRTAASAWMARRFNIAVPASDIAACVGTKELVAGVPHWLQLRRPDRDTVLYPSVSYPTYEMGAQLAGCRAVPYDDVKSIDSADVARALCVWVNTPSNPTGELSDLGAAAAFGREHSIPVFSDECYVEFIWEAAPASILQHGSEGVVVVHSLSKRSNLAGARAGFYAGDPELVSYLRELRKHAGMMVPGPVQAAAAVALDDDDHVAVQRERYRTRLERLRQIMAAVDSDAPMPEGGFYLWAPAPGGDAWALAKRLAADAGAVVSPGEFYGPGGSGHVRVAAVQPDDRIELVASRLGI